MRFSFYKVSSVYCDFLRAQEPAVPYTRADKSTRPFVGVVFELNGFNYYAPLTSPKPKHLHMKKRSFAAFIRDEGTSAILPTTKFLRSYFFNSSNVKENEGTKCSIKYATSGRAAYFSILAAAAAKATSNSWLPLCNSSAHFR